jgi:hypothetical protein
MGSEPGGRKRSPRFESSQSLIRFSPGEPDERVNRMASTLRRGSGPRIRRLVTRSPLAVLPLLTLGVLVAAPSAASAATTATPTQPGNLGVNLGPTIADLEAEVTTVVNDVELVPCAVNALFNTLEGGGFEGC